MRCVGILGGMGPEATIALMRLVLQAVPARQDADHVPLIVDQNPQVPSRVSALLQGGAKDPAPVLQDMARRLQAAGAQALAMPCNTAHHYRAQITSACGLPLLDMVELASRAAAALDLSDASIGVLASPAVQRTGIYARALHALDRQTLYPEDQPGLLAALQEVKANGPSAQAAAILHAASAELQARGAAVQIIACSEFSLLPAPLATEVQAVDALDCLAHAIVALSKSG